MSLIGLQSALAYAIRSFDAHNVKSLDELTHAYELTPEETLTLENLIHQQRLKAYSEELFLARWTIIRGSLDFLAPIIDLRALSDFWEQDFEKKSTRIVCEDLALKFVEYLVYDPAGSKFIGLDPRPFLPDLMKYIHAVLTFRHNVLPKIALPAHSLLTDRYFAVISLEYDVREFFAELIEPKDEKAVDLKDPPQRDVTLLFIATEEVTDFRAFEIDQELAGFLQAQRRGDLNAVVPACYDDLVEAGLCKPRGMKRACCSKIH